MIQQETDNLAADDGNEALCLATGKEEEISADTEIRLESSNNDNEFVTQADKVPENRLEERTNTDPIVTTIRKRKMQ